MFPHSPYRFNADCSYRNQESEGQAGYLDNLRCTNRQVLEMIDWIDRHSPNAIVIFQSDHGYALGGESVLDSNFLPVGVDVEAFDGLAGTLSAWRLPQRCQRSLPANLTAVNTFRIVFACLERNEPELLRNRYFFSSYQSFMLKPYRGLTLNRDRP